MHFHDHLSGYSERLHYWLETNSLFRISVSLWVIAKNRLENRDFIITILLLKSLGFPFLLDLVMDDSCDSAGNALAVTSLLTRFPPLPAYMTIVPYRYSYSQSRPASTPRALPFFVKVFQ